jgi:predicted transcriptional regulator
MKKHSVMMETQLMKTQCNTDIRAAEMRSKQWVSSARAMKKRGNGHRIRTVKVICPIEDDNKVVEDE